MTVSVVIPCFDSLEHLPSTLESVLAQRGVEIDVVLVDDGGTDDVQAWVGEQADPRVRLVRQDNAGPAAARNRGIAESDSALVAFLDSDDVWDPDYLAKMVRCFEDPEVGLAYSGWDVIDAEGRPNGRATVSSWEGDVWELFVTRNPVACSGAVVRREVFDQVGVFAVNRDRFPIDVEDWEMWVRIASSHRVAVVPEVLVHHRRHDANSSSNPESLAAAYAHFLDTVFDGQPPERLVLRPLATARTEVLLGWHMLADRRDARQALGYRRSAARHAPVVRRSADWWRLGAAATALRIAGERGFRMARRANHSFRRVLARLPLGRLRREGTFSP